MLQCTIKVYIPDCIPESNTKYRNICNNIICTLLYIYVSSITRKFKLRAVRYSNESGLALTFIANFNNFRKILTWVDSLN